MGDEYVVRRLEELYKQAIDLSAQYEAQQRKAQQLAADLDSLQADARIGPLEASPIQPPVPRTKTQQTNSAQAPAAGRFQTKFLDGVRNYGFQCMDTPRIRQVTAMASPEDGQGRITLCVTTDHGDIIDLDLVDLIQWLRKNAPELLEVHDEHEGNG